MVATLEPFLEALRNELQQYGEMLALLETQQSALNQRSTDAVGASIASLNAQSAVIESARCTRETLQRQLAWALGVPEEKTVRQLIPRVPADYQPLLAALAQEIQELLVRVRECARKNCDHLQGSLQEMEYFIARLAPLAQAAHHDLGKPIPDADETPPSAVATAV